MRLADVENLAEVEGGVREKLDRLLARLVTHLRNLSETISHTYLIHAGPSRQMSELAPRESLIEHPACATRSSTPRPTPTATRCRSATTRST